MEEEVGENMQKLKPFMEIGKITRKTIGQKA